jgi:hypothetical protein
MNKFSLFEKQKKNIRNIKTLKDNFTNTIDERQFLLEKIEKDILKGKNNIKHLRSNSLDDHLTKLRQNLKKKVKKKNFLNPNNSSPKNFDHIYRFIKKQNNLKLKSIKNNLRMIPTKNILTRQKSDINLPVINNRKIIKQFLLKKSRLPTLSFIEKIPLLDNKEKISNSAMLGSNDIYANISRIIKIRSFSNICKDNDLSNDKYSEENNINEIDSKYNLNLNSKIKYKKLNSIFNGKKYTKFGILNKLFEYYSSKSNNGISPNNENMENKSSNYINFSKSNNSIIDNNDEMSKNNIDESNIFLTKIKSNKNESEEKYNKFSVTRFISDRCSVGDINKRNKKIIEDNKKVSIDCLLSKIERKISVKKILYKYLDKTIYEIENDKSYTRLKEFEKNILDILKNVE